MINCCLLEKDMGKKGTGKVIKTCKKCNLIFYARHDRPGIYCSKSCASKDRKHKTYRINKKCLVCLNSFTVKRYRTHSASYCSIQCMAQARGKSMRGENHHNWKGGISERPWKVRKAIKEAKKNKNYCERCGEKNNLHGHHKIKYSENNTIADDLTNIEIICSKCHILEHPELEGMLSVPPIRKGVYLECRVCESKYYIPRYKIGKSRWCSRKCAIIGLNQLRNKNGKEKLDTRH